MNKHLIILGIAVLLISVVGLSGCNEISNPISSEESRFIGTWKLLEASYNISSFGEVTVTFYDDGRAKTINNYSSLEHDYEQDVYIAWSYYNIEDDKLCMTPEYAPLNYTIYGFYTFSDNYARLTLIDCKSSSLISTYVKIS